MKEYRLQILNEVGEVQIVKEYTNKQDLINYLMSIHPVGEEAPAERIEVESSAEEVVEEVVDEVAEETVEETTEEPEVGEAPEEKKKEDSEESSEDSSEAE